MLILLFMGITLFQPQEPVTQTDLKILEDKIQNKIDSQKNDVNAMWNGLDKRTSDSENKWNWFIWVSGLGGVSAFGAVLLAFFSTRTYFKEQAEKEIKTLINKNRRTVNYIIENAVTDESILKTEKILIVTKDSDSELYDILKKLKFVHLDQVHPDNLNDRSKDVHETPDLLLFDRLSVDEIESKTTLFEMEIFHVYTIDHLKFPAERKRYFNLTNSFVTLYSNLMNTARFRRRLLDQ